MSWKLICLRYNFKDFSVVEFGALVSFFSDSILTLALKVIWLGFYSAIPISHGSWFKVSWGCAHAFNTIVGALDLLNWIVPWCSIPSEESDC